MSVEETIAPMDFLIHLDDRPFDMPYVTVGPKIKGGDNIHKALASDGQLLAVKEVEVTGLEAEEDLVLLKELSKEIDILGRTSHENIVQYRYFSLTVNKKTVMQKMNFTLRMYMDFVRHDTLKTRYKEFPLSEPQVGRYTRDILSGIDYLHEKNIVHRDIRCANIWVDDKGVCKLVNFGKAKESFLRVRSEEGFGANASNLEHLRNRMDEICSHTKLDYPHWMAPEIARGRPYQKPVDIWSLGCTVLEMLTQRKPFEACGEEVPKLEVLERLQNNQCTCPAVPDFLSETARNFLKRCLQLEPENRPTAKDLLGDPFVNPPTRDPMGQFVPGHDFLSESLGELESDSVTNEAGETSFESYPVEPQTQGDRVELSVDDMCGRVSEELEILKSMDDSAAIVISSEWLEKWQSDDDRVYRRLLIAGYVKTLETDSYACFEKLFESSDGGGFDYLPTDAPAEEHLLNSVAVEETTQEGTHSTDSSRPLGNTRESGSRDRVNPSDSSSEYADETGRPKSGEQGRVTIVESEMNDLEISGTAPCTEECPHIPLTVVRRENDATPPVKGRADPSANMELVMGQETYRVHLSLRCCVRGNRLCIKLVSFKGEMINFPLAKGAILLETRLSVAVAVGGYYVILKPVDPSSDGKRVCSSAVAEMDDVLRKGKDSVTVEFAPSFQGMGFGASIGSYRRMRKNEPEKLLSHRNDSLPLVTLGYGDTGCGLVDPSKKTLVLNRHLRHTWHVGKCNDLPCMDSHAESTPIILEGRLEGDFPDDIQITCCAQMYTSLLPIVTQQAIRKIKLVSVKRKEVLVSLCESNCESHVTFKGKIQRH